MINNLYRYIERKYYEAKRLLPYIISLLEIKGTLIKLSYLIFGFI